MSIIQNYLMSIFLMSIIQFVGTLETVKKNRIISFLLFAAKVTFTFSNVSIKTT